MDMFKQKIITTYKKTLGKGVKYFTKKLQKFSKQTGTTLENSLFSIGREITKPKISGKKKKNGKLIPIRRQYKHRREFWETSEEDPKIKTLESRWL